MPFLASDGHVYGAATLLELGAHDARSPLTRELLRPLAYPLGTGKPLRVYDAATFPRATLRLALSVDTLPNDDAALFLASLLEAAGAPAGACTLALCIEGARVTAPPLAAGAEHAARCAALCAALRIAHLAPDNPGDVAAGCRVLEAGCSLEDAVLRAPLESGPLVRILAASRRASSV